jgi:hypothetical protein
MLHSVIVLFMPTLDIAMPIALLVVITVAVYLNKRVEGKLKATVEEKEFQTKDVIMLVVVMGIVISIIAYTSIFNPGEVFPNILLAIFLGSYSMLLFTFSLIFSNLQKFRAQLLSVGFGIASAIAGAISLLGPLSDDATIVRAASFFGLAIYCFAVTLYEQKKPSAKERWYIALQPPAIFLLLFVFFNLVYGGAIRVWDPFLMDVFGFTFAILIILYLSSMFTWKTVGIFAILLTILDIILVIGTGTMVEAAQTFTGLGLPVLVYLPNVPFVYSTTGALAFRGLGLGDFFFAGILAIQTYKKFGQKTAIASMVAMTVAFGLWEAFLYDILVLLEPIVGRSIGGFPGTLMIICGWAPIVAWQLIAQRRNKTPPPPPEVLQEPKPPFSL